jgi:hypothetical protein
VLPATVTLLTATPEFATFTVLGPEIKLFPVSVTATAVPRSPVLGETEEIVGGGIGLIVKFTALLVPAEVATVKEIVLGFGPSSDGTAKLNVTCVGLTTVTPETVPGGPFTVSGAEKPLPVRVTFTFVPVMALFGVIDVITGPATGPAWLTVNAADAGLLNVIPPDRAEPVFCATV